MADENCSKCGGTGWRIVERSGLSGAEKCDCVSTGRGEALFDNARIPQNYEGATLDTFNASDNPITRNVLGGALLAAKAFARDFPMVSPPGLLFMGGTGTGKTHLAIGVMRALIEKGHACVFFDYQNLLDKIRASYDAASGTSDREAYATALDADVLILDDLGAHRITDWVEDIVASIITYRCNHRKPLIATTNLPDSNVTGKVVDYRTPSGREIPKKDLTEMIGMRARSRLFEMCKVVKMEVSEDYRVKNAKYSGETR